MTVDAMTTQRLTVHASRLIAGAALSIEAVLRYQACDDTTCLPPASLRETFSLPLGGGAPGASGAADGGAPHSASGAAPCASIISHAVRASRPVNDICSAIIATMIGTANDVPSGSQANS